MSNEDKDDSKRPQKNDMLKMYYGMNAATVEGRNNNPLDIDSPNFNAELYLRKLKHENGLAELMDTENDMAKQIRTLDSDMQTLVYENYNKFISATDTIRTMKRDFRQMEDEMAKLTNNMQSITQLNSKINTTLQTNRQQIAKLSGVHLLLTKLQFLFELPSRLKKCLETKSYSTAVNYYSKTKAVLQHYQHMESFSGIERDCREIINKIIAELKEVFHDKHSSPHQLAECVGLLLQLGEPGDSLCEDYLQHAKQKLDEDLADIKSYLISEVTVSSSEELLRDAVGATNLLIDILEFIDRGSNGFLSNLSLTIAAYGNLFIKQTDMVTMPPQYSVVSIVQSDEMRKCANNKLHSFVEDLLKCYFALVEERLLLDKRSRDNALVVRALDRFYRRLQATSNLLPSLNIMSYGRDIILRIAKARCHHYKLALEEFFTDCLTDARHAISAPKHVTGKSVDLLDLVNSAASALLNQVKSVLADVQLFTIRDINFSSLTYFSREFGVVDVREEIIVNFLHYISKTLLSFCDASSAGRNAPPSLLLLLSRLCRDFEQSTVAYILTLTDEQFLISRNERVTPVAELTNQIGETAQKLLESFVQSSGVSLSRMIRTSIEARDWLKCVEPRQVRAVMRRVVEEVTSTDQQVGCLYEEGFKRARSSDSSKRTLSHQASTSRQRERAHWGMYAPSVLQKGQKWPPPMNLAPVPTKHRIEPGTSALFIIDKTCALVQQVDCHYLQLYLWQFVADENIVHGLLDEVVTSSVHRSIDPVLMEPSVIDVICERG